MRSPSGFHRALCFEAGIQVRGASGQEQNRDFNPSVVRAQNS